MTTAIGRVRGLGSAHEGTEHWWHQRLTAGANLFLGVWFIASLVLLPDLNHATIVAWLGSATNAVPLILLVVSVFWHFRLGLQTVIEDYQSDDSRVVLMVLLNFASIAAATLALFSILKIAFTGSAD